MLRGSALTFKPKTPHAFTTELFAVCGSSSKNDPSDDPKASRHFGTFDPSKGVESAQKWQLTSSFRARQGIDCGSKGHQGSVMES